MRHKDGSDDDRPLEDRRGESRSSDTQESTRDTESRRRCKSNAAPALPDSPGPVLTDDRDALVVYVQASATEGTAARDAAAQMRVDDAGRARRVTSGTDRSPDALCFAKACRKLKVGRPVAQNIDRSGGNAIDGGMTSPSGLVTWEVAVGGGSSPECPRVR